MTDMDRGVRGVFGNQRDGVKPKSASREAAFARTMPGERTPRHSDSAFGDPMACLVDLLTGLMGILRFGIRAALSFSRFSSARFLSLFSLFSLFLIFSFSSLFLIFSSLFLISSSLLLILSFSFLFLSIFLSFLSLLSRLWRFLAPRSTSRDTCASYNGAPRYVSCGGKANPEEAGA